MSAASGSRLRAVAPWHDDPAGAAALLATATRTAAEMLVLGARGRGGFAKLRLGSVSQHCVEHASCPVDVRRADHEVADGPFIIGLDGSEGPRQALEWTIDRLPDAERIGRRP